MNFYDILLARCLCCNSDDACPCPKSSSGDIITITDGAENTPLKSAVVNIEPVQDLHGYSYPWPAGGGVNKFETKNVGRTDAGVTYALESDGKIKLTGTASATSYLYTQPTYDMLTLVPAGSYILSGGLSSNIRLVTTSYTVGPAPSYTVTKIADIAYDYGNGATFTLSSDTYVGVNFRIQSGQATNVTVGIQIEAGSTPTAWQPYSNICPISGWTQVNVWVKPAYESPHTTPITIPLGRTVYGGTLDVVRRKLTIDRAMVDLGTLNWTYRDIFAGFSAQLSPTAKDKFNAVCSAYLYGGAYSDLSDKQCGYVYFNQVFVKDSSYTDAATFKTAMSGVQLVYELATPIEVDLTPQTIMTLLGTNNIWADAGEISIEYYPAAVS